MRTRLTLSDRALDAWYTAKKACDSYVPLPQNTRTGLAGTLEKRSMDDLVKAIRMIPDLISALDAVQTQLQMEREKSAQ